MTTFTLTHEEMVTIMQVMVLDNKRLKKELAASGEETKKWADMYRETFQDAALIGKLKNELEVANSRCRLLEQEKSDLKDFLSAAAEKEQDYLETIDKLEQECSRRSEDQQRLRRAHEDHSKTIDILTRRVAEKSEDYRAARAQIDADTNKRSIVMGQMCAKVSGLQEENTHLKRVLADIKNANPSLFNEEM